MRIIAGQLKGRLFRAPPAGATHPMGERARGAIFNMLQDISGLEVLDAYAGTGALAFEALSRGAGRVTAIEVNRRAYKLLHDNASKLESGERLICKRANVTSYLASTGKDYDLIFVDPPYQTIKAEALERIGRHLRPQGRLVLSYPKSFQPTFTAPSWQVLSQKTYAAAQIMIWLKL